MYADCLTKQQASLLHAFVEAGKSTLELLWGKGLADSPAARQLAHALHAAWLAHVAAAANLRTGTPDLHHAAPADMPRPAEMFTASEVDATWVPALDATFSTNDEGQDSATDVLLPHLNPQHSCASAWIQQVSQACPLTGHAPAEDDTAAHVDMLVALPSHIVLCSTNDVCCSKRICSRC